MVAEIEDNHTAGNGAAPAEHPPASIEPARHLRVGPAALRAAPAGARACAASARAQAAGLAGAADHPHASSARLVWGHLRQPAALVGRHRLDRARPGAPARGRASRGGRGRCRALFLDNALISISLAPDWAKFLAAALVTAVLALIGLGLINGDSSSDDVPDGFVPQTPELEDGAIPSP